MKSEHSKLDKELLKKVGKRISYLRNQRGLSQHDLSTLANMSKAQLGRTERAEINTSLVSLNKIALALEIDIKEFFEFELPQ